MTGWDKPGIIDRLRKLCATNGSFSEIAVTLNREFHVGFSRNAVLGKSKRLGITKPAASSQHRGERPPARMDGKVSALPRVIRKPAVAAQPNAARVKLKSDGTVAPYFAPTPFPEEPPIFDASTNCTLLELREHMCRWPLGDPRDESFRFCGARTSDDLGPYCPDHTRMAYQPRDARKDRALARIIVNNLPKAQAIRRGAVA